MEKRLKIIDQFKDKISRHQERYQLTGYQFVISESIRYVNQADWDQVAKHSSVFLSQQYLKAIEQCSPSNTQQRCAIAYDEDHQPVVIVVCQLAEIGGENINSEHVSLINKVKDHYQERVLVCGNLVSSGLHGVGIMQDFDQATAWRVVSEVLYKIRQAEKLTGAIDFVMIKDINENKLKPSEVLERYSYRRIQTDPDMVLKLDKQFKSFDDYLSLLTAKYRGRIKKIVKQVDQAGLVCEPITLDEQSDACIHKLYLEVENKSATRLATLPVGYFLALQQHLGELFCCYAIKNDQEIVGFVSVVKDRNRAIAYYVGLDYQVNKTLPIYFRLLQLVINVAIEWGSDSISFGRTALEPKANLGAEPEEEFVWARHRVPVVNYMVRKLFRNIPFDVAPKRSVKKQKK